MGNYISKNTDMLDEGRIKLTPRLVNKAIVTHNKRKLLYRLMCFSGILLICAVMLFAIICDSPLNDVWTMYLRVFCISALVLIPSACLLCFFLENKGVSQGKYVVITDKVERVIPRSKYVFGFELSMGRYWPESEMFLEKTRSVFIPEKDVGRYSENDVIYFIARKKHPNKPLVIYNAKYYELEQ